MQQGDAPMDVTLAEIGLDNFTPYLMNRIMGRYNAALQSQMSKLGLTTAQMRALAVLSEQDGLLIRDLAVYSVVEQSTLSRALDKLHRDGLIARQSDPEDQRATRIHLTPQGRAAFARLWPDMAASYAQMFDGIEPSERSAFTATLHKMLKNVRLHDI